MELEEEKITKVLDSMMGAIEQEKIDLYKELIKKRGNIKIEDYEDFFFSLVYPHKQFLEGLIKTEISKNDDVCFILINSRYVESHFVQWIQQKEGGACSADKSRTIMRSLLKWFKVGQKIVWNYEQEYTYHLPRKVFTTHEDIILFYEGIKSLHYGNPQKYLESLKSLIKS